MQSSRGTGRTSRRIGLVYWLILSASSSGIFPTPGCSAVRSGDDLRVIGRSFAGLTTTATPRKRHSAERWPDAGPPVLWTCELGQGYSSFVAWDDRVATQAQTLAGQYVICLRADTGETIWRHRYDWPYEPAGVYPGPRATPTYANGKIYFAAPSGRHRLPRCGKW